MNFIEETTALKGIIILSGILFFFFLYSLMKRVMLKIRFRSVTVSNRNLLPAPSLQQNLIKSGYISDFYSNPVLFRKHTLN